jgi:hypothetical protein
MKIFTILTSLLLSLNIFAVNDLPEEEEPTPPVQGLLTLAPIQGGAPIVVTLLPNLRTEGSVVTLNISDTPNQTTVIGTTGNNIVVFNPDSQRLEIRREVPQTGTSQQNQNQHQNQQ